MEYLALVVILGGLGAMAYFMTKSGKNSENKRAAVAEARGWNYIPNNSSYVLNVPDQERNISYRLNGNTGGGTKWELTARHLKSIDKSSVSTLSLGSSTELTADKHYTANFLLMPHDGITLPDFILAEIFKMLDFPIDTPRVEAEQLPGKLAVKYALYTFNPEALDFLDRAAEALEQWQGKYPGKQKALIIAGGPEGFKVRTEMQVDKEADLEFFVDTALAMLD